MKYVYSVFYQDSRGSYFYTGKGFSSYVGYRRLYSSEVKAKRIIKELIKKPYYKKLDLSLSRERVY